MNYFRYFTQTSYTLSLPDGDRTVTLTNLTNRAILKQAIIKNVSVFYDYVIGDGERPDSVAYKLYGSTGYTWLILVVNNIIWLYDWPLTPQQFNDYIMGKYGSVAAAQAQTIYTTVDGYQVDATTWGLLASAEQGPTQTQYDLELTANEDKRRIKIVPTGFLPQIQLELKSLFH